MAVNFTSYYLVLNTNRIEIVASIPDRAMIGFLVTFKQSKKDKSTQNRHSTKKNGAKKRPRRHNTGNQPQ